MWEYSMKELISRNVKCFSRYFASSSRMIKYVSHEWELLFILYIRAGGLKTEGPVKTRGEFMSLPRAVV